MESEKGPWVDGFPHGAPVKDELAHLVDVDRDEAEVAYYEAAADPTFVAVERSQRAPLVVKRLFRRVRRWCR